MADATTEVPSPTPRNNILQPLKDETRAALLGESTRPPATTMARLYPKTKNAAATLLRLPLLIILVLYAGPPGADTLASAIRQAAPHLSQHVVEIDILRDSHRHDMHNDDLFTQLLVAAREGRILAILGGPNCRTWSKLLSRKRHDGHFHGPLRGREPWALWGLHTNEEHHQRKCDDDNILLLRQLLLIYEAFEHGVSYLLEHPADPGPPHPSWWISDQCSSLLRLVGGRLHTFDACRLGQITAKATTVATNLEDLHWLHDLRCKCRYPHYSRDDYEGMARWPWQLMLGIATALSTALALDPRIRAKPGPQRPLPTARNTEDEGDDHHQQGRRWREVALAPTDHQSQPVKQHHGCSRMSEYKPRARAQFLDTVLCQSTLQFCPQNKRQHA